MRYLSLFSGIEAATAAWHPLGWTPVAFAEVEPFPSAVLAHHYPGTPNLGDITKITEEDITALGPIDLVVGGFPCQDVSVAGKRKGLKNDDGSATRSGLFFDAMRIVRWARKHCGCRWVLIENVPGLYSSNSGADFASVVGEVVGSEFGVPRNGWRTAGVAAGPDGLCEWVCLDAQWFGVAQRRRRCFIVGDFGDWANRPPLFLEQHRLQGDSSPRREKRQTAPTIPARSTGGGGLATDFDCDGGLMVMSSGQANAEITKEVSPTLNLNLNLNRDGAPIAFTIHGTQDPCVGEESAFALGRNSGQENAVFAIQAGASRTNPNSGPDGVGVQADQAYTLEARAEVQAVCITGDITHTLKAEGFDASEDGTGRGQPIVFQPRYARNGRGAPDTIAAPLTAEAGRTGKGDSAQCVAFAQNQRDEVRMMDVAGALAAEPGMKQQTYVATSAVRRLTPRECERLQDFPDDFTAIPWRGKPADQCPDGPRYKALGNSFAVPVVRWLGERIQAVEAELCRTTASNSAMNASAATGSASPAAKSAMWTS